MKDDKKLQESFASLTIDFEKLYKEMQAKTAAMSKPAGGADYKGQPNTVASSPQYEPADSGPHNPTNYDGKDSNLKFEEWAQGMYAMMDNIHSRMSNMKDTMYNHKDEHQQAMASHLKGHPPHPKTPTQMEAYLKATKMDSDFEVQKPIISNYAYKTVASRRGAEIEFEIKPKNK